MYKRIAITVTEEQKSALIRAANSRNISLQDLVIRSLVEKGVMDTSKVYRKNKKGISYSFYRVPAEIDSVARIVAQVFGVSVRDIFSNKRHIEIMTARHCLRYILKKNLKVGGYKKIGLLTNFSDHSTAIYSVKTFQNFIDTDKEIRANYEKVEKTLNRIKQ